jgi:hypothetical protein
VVLPLPDGPTNATMRPPPMGMDRSGTTTRPSGGPAPKSWATSTVRRDTRGLAGIRRQAILSCRVTSVVIRVFLSSDWVAQASSRRWVRDKGFGSKQKPNIGYNAGDGLSIIWQ